MSKKQILYSIFFMLLGITIEKLVDYNLFYKDASETIEATQETTKQLEKDVKIIKEETVPEFRYKDFYLDAADSICRIKKVTINNIVCFKLMDEFNINYPISTKNCKIIIDPNIKKPIIKNFYYSYKGGDFKYETKGLYLREGDILYIMSKKKERDNSIGFFGEFVEPINQPLVEIIIPKVEYIK